MFSHCLSIVCVSRTPWGYFLNWHERSLGLSEAQRSKVTVLMSIPFLWTENHISSNLAQLIRFWLLLWPQIRDENMSLDRHACNCNVTGRWRHNHEAVILVYYVYHWFLVSLQYLMKHLLRTTFGFLWEILNSKTKAEHCDDCSFTKNNNNVCYS